MPPDDALKRLGGGRWETRDGRFAIEPQSGTWVVVDNSQADDLGLPLVRGPFATLTAARTAIESARGAGPVESPLANRIREARLGAAKAQKPKTSLKAPMAKAAKSARPETPKPPPEPKWLRDLEPADRLRAFQLIERLAKVGIAEPEEIVRAEIVADQPALARLALERALGEALASTDDPADAVRAAIKAILSGKDGKLGASWRLVDDRGRQLDRLDIPD